MVLKFSDQNGWGWLVPVVSKAVSHGVQVTDPLLDTRELLGDSACALSTSKLLEEVFLPLELLSPLVSILNLPVYASYPVMILLSLIIRVHPLEVILKY